MGLLRGVLLAVGAYVIWAIVRIFLPKPLDNIPGPTKKNYSLLGDMPSLFGRHGFAFHEEVWSKFEYVARINGWLGNSILYVWDPKALYQIVVKDQYIYEESMVFLNVSKILFGTSLLSTVGSQHRQQRKILNPVFNANHMRSLVPTFYALTHQLRNAITNELQDGEKELDMLNWMTRCALELVGRGGLGHSFDPLDRDWKNPFVTTLKSIGPTLAPLFFFLEFLPLALKIASPPTWRKIIERLPFKRVQDCLYLADTISAKVNEILAHKKELLANGDAELEHQVGEGKDIISVLLRANILAPEEDKMADEEILGHMSSLLVAAMDTTSNALARILQILSQHPDVQEKLRQEIIAARDGKEYLDYDELMNLPYLEAVCRETLRLHSPSTQILRETTQEVVMPLSQPIRGNDGTMIDEIVLPKKSAVVIGILACNRSTAIWGPDANEWKPERWLKLPDSVTDAHVPGIYSNLMTFLGGGRACIGSKFAQLEMKTVLSTLIESFEFAPSDKEIYWNWNTVQYPTVGADSDEPMMPLRVRLVQRKA